VSGKTTDLPLACWQTTGDDCGISRGQCGECRSREAGPASFRLSGRSELPAKRRNLDPLPSGITIASGCTLDSAQEAFMTAPQNILVATDFGPVAEAALKYGRTLAQTFGARLHVLHAMENQHGTGAGENGRDHIVKPQLHEKTLEPYRQRHFAHGPQGASASTISDTSPLPGEAKYHMRNLPCSTTTAGPPRDEASTFPARPRM